MWAHFCDLAPLLGYDAPVTLSLLSEAAMKVRVSRHVACTWTWGLRAVSDDDSGPQYFLTLRKCHPFWEMFTEAVQHLPAWLPYWVQERDWYAQLKEKHSAKVGEVEVDEFTAKSLYAPIYDLVHGDDEDETP